MCPFSLSNLPKIARKVLIIWQKKEVDSMDDSWGNSARYFQGHVGREMADSLQYKKMCSSMKYDKPSTRNH